MVPCPAHTCYPTSSSPALSQTTVFAQTTARGGACEGVGEGHPTSWWGREGWEGVLSPCSPLWLLHTHLLPGGDTSVDSCRPPSPTDTPRPCRVSPNFVALQTREAPPGPTPHGSRVVLCTSNPWAQWLCYGSQTPTAPLPPGSLTTALRSPRPNAALTRAPSHLLPGPHGRPWSKQRDVGVDPKRSYRELNARVPAFPAWPMQSSPVGAVAGVSPPPAQHGAAGPPAQGARPWAPAAWGLLQGPRPLCAPQRGSLTPKGCGLGLPARFFLEMEGVFISSRFFLENMVGPGPSGPRQAGRGHAGWGSQGCSSPSWLPRGHIAAGHPLPSCQAHVTGPALIGGPSPRQEKASGGGE